MEVYPRVELANPPGMKAFSVEIRGLSKTFRAFLYSVWYAIAPADFAPIRASPLFLEGGPLPWHACEGPGVSGLRWSELRTQVRRDSLVTLVATPK